MNRCRACDAPILWARMAKTGKRNPLNPEPDQERGNVQILELEEEAAYHGVPVDTAIAHGPDDAAALRSTGTPLYLSHFASCPQRGRFRGRSKQG